MGGLSRMYVTAGLRQLLPESIEQSQCLMAMQYGKTVSSVYSPLTWQSGSKHNPIITQLEQ